MPMGGFNQLNAQPLSQILNGFQHVASDCRPVDVDAQCLVTGRAAERNAVPLRSINRRDAENSFLSNRGERGFAMRADSHDRLLLLLEAAV
jgi:hypothetical protein